MLQPTRYWPEFCRLFGLDEYAEDPRFASLESMAANSDTAFDIVRDAIVKMSFAECKELLGRGTGQWAPVQDAWEVGNDEALIANGRITEVIDAEGNPHQLVASPVKFDQPPTETARAPQFAEHT